MEIEHMKWYGWGKSNTVFNIKDRPKLWPYILKVSGMTNADDITTVIDDIDQIILPEQRINQQFAAEIETILKNHQIKSDKNERLLHSYGKSYRDLWRIQNGQIDSAVDMVCYPESEQDIQSIVTLAEKFQVILIPFGGGSNIAGCLEPRDSQNKMVVSVDMRRMNRVLEVDPYSMTAVIQAGAMGPQIESQLNQHGMTLGHFPDSFEHSSLGGWVATRSAGMQSDKYGKIEDMVIALRLVTPSGTIVTRAVPRAANGISINHLCIGSEGILGIMTEITVQIHAQPERREFYGYLFPDFERGVAAIHQCIKEAITPSMVRLNDPSKTMLSFAYQSKPSLVKSIISFFIKFYLKRIKNFDFEKACIAIIAIEDSKKNFNRQKNQINQIYKKYGGVHLGKGPGRSFEKGKYDFPYLRDFVMSKGVISDVSETATTWKNILPLYYKTQQSILNAIQKLGANPWCGCHISHTYKTGASLYFTFAFKQQPGDTLVQYQQVKKAAEDAFIQGGGYIVTSSCCRL